MLDAQWVVQIYSKDGDLCIGTGYLITDKLILTARHVVFLGNSVSSELKLVFPERDNNGNLKKQGENYIYDLNNAISFESNDIVFKGDEQLDVAIICCPKELRPVPPMVNLALVNPSSNTHWEMRGFPKAGKVENIRREQLGFTVDRQGMRNESVFELHTTVNLTPDLFRTENGWGGLSGAPVFFGNQLVAVITDKYTTVDSYFYAISIPYLLRNNDAFKKAVGCPNFIKHWTNWSIERLKSTSDGLLGNNLVPSPIESEWWDFIYSSWRDYLCNTLKYFESLTQATDFKKLFETLPDISGTYEDVRKVLKTWYETVNSKLHNLKKTELISGYARQELYELKRILNDIKQIADPESTRLGIVFSIFGYLGCGKTQFLLSRAIQADDAIQKFDNQHHPIPLLLPLKSWPVEQDIDQVILKQVEQATGGYLWSSLEELNLSLLAFNIKLVLVIDDFDQLLRNIKGDDFIKFIAKNTKFDSLAYLLAIQDTQLDLISGQATSWLRYSYEKQYHKETQKRHDHCHIPHMAGWLNLAEFNLKHQIGYQILNNAGHRWVVELFKEQGNQPSPLEAQILLFLIEENEENENFRSIGSLNFFGFVAKFREKLMKDFDALMKRDIKLAIRHIAEAVVRTSSLNPPLSTFMNPLSPASNNNPVNTIKLLKDISLLGINDSERYESDETIRLNYPFLWNQEFAIQIWDDFSLANSSESQSNAIEWLLRIKDNNIRSGILEFVLLLSYRKMSEKDITLKRASDIWLISFKRSELSARAPCFAARWVDEKYIHKKIASALRANASSIVARGDLFALMFFAMETPTLSPGERFKFLKPYYQNIHDKGFSAYFLYGAERIFIGLKDFAHPETHLENCLSMLATSHLTGSEVEQLADCAWESFVEIHGHIVEKNLKILMNGYLLFDKENALNEYKSWDTLQNGRRPRYFRQLLLERALDWSWRQKEKYSVHGFFELLIQTGWYEATKKRIYSHIAHEMRSAANLSFGRHFRWLAQDANNKEKKEEINSYKIIVRDLLEGKFNDISRSQELGYFMLRHTDYIAGKTAHIPQVLWDEVDVAQRANGLQKFLTDFPITKEVRREKK
jgi:V8-like Glu-specific endopeptidase